MEPIEHWFRRGLHADQLRQLPGRSYLNAGLCAARYRSGGDHRHVVASHLRTAAGVRR
jgi:hypothetical protein